MPPPHPFEHNISQHAGAGNQLNAVFGKLAIQEYWQGMT